VTADGELIVDVDYMLVEGLFDNLVGAGEKRRFTVAPPDGS
jgi:hypothetical protein